MQGRAHLLRFNHFHPSTWQKHLHLIKAKVRRMPETTKYFPSFSLKSLPLSHRWEKTRKDAATRCKNTALFYPFCKTHLSKFGHKPQKTVYFTPKMEQKRGLFFLFLWFFAPTSKKNNRIISQTIGFYLTLGWKYTTVTHKALAIPTLLAFFPTTLVYRNTIP